MHHKRQSFPVALVTVVAIASGRCWATPANAVEQEVTYIWPTVVWAEQLFSPSRDDRSGVGVAGAVQDMATATRLADIGERGYDHYVKNVLPQELEVDNDFAREFNEADGSRINLGFLRWQKRIYSDMRRVPIEEIQWDGKPVPHVRGVEYAWPELYDSREFKVIRKMVSSKAGVFLNRVTRDKEKMKFRIFTWVEAYRPGDFQRPHAHTGAALAGIFFAKHTVSSMGGQELIFEDSRGVNPPFGQSHGHQPVEGELVLWPAWASHYLSPNPGNSTNVYFNFLLWPPGGTNEFDWEDDPTGDFSWSKMTHVRKTPLTEPMNEIRGSPRDHQEL